MLEAARREARKQFDRNRNFSPDSEEAAKAIAHAEDAARILKHNIAQGRQVEKGIQRYSMFDDKLIGLKRPNLPVPSELRIHEHIERGDNESMKESILSKATATEGCWSQ